jgi:hypothetical protein
MRWGRLRRPSWRFEQLLRGRHHEQRCALREQHGRRVPSADPVAATIAAASATANAATVVGDLRRGW